MKFSYIKKIQVFFTFLIVLGFSSSIFAQTTYNISDPAALEDENYGPGDVIILANGIYDTDERIDFLGSGTAEDPIIFRAESPGGVIFTGGLPMNIAGDYLVVDGFHWSGGYGANNFIQFRNGTDYANNCLIQNCAIDGLARSPEEVAEDLAENASTKHRWVVLYGNNNSVLNCSFMNKTNAGALILAEYQYNEEADPCIQVGHTINNNYFYNYEKIDNTLTNSGDSETIRIGSSGEQNVQSNMTVTNNYFVQSDGENEIITNKSRGNFFINNTFRRCRGSLVMRHGSGATVDGNYFLGENVDGTGGLRISDSNHSITNNYIQDCITVASQAKWNNGVTFLGGGDVSAPDCTFTNLTNGYQKSENITVSNNSFVNTNAPLFYNIDKGTTDPEGSVANNLIYFTAGNANISDIISGDEADSYSTIGTTLDYLGNVYTGTSLGETNAGFSSETDIMATSQDEIFTFSGSGAAGKGANLGTYTPTTDEMVGYEIGACFLDYLGANINDGDCDIAIGDYLTVSGLAIFPAIESSADVMINTNVSWSVAATDNWISVENDSGTGNATVSVTVSANTETISRVGSIIFTQDAGGDDLTKTLTITQAAADLTDLYELINIGTGAPDDKVTLHSFSKEEVNDVDKFNYANNTLDKDNGTVWAADDDAIVEGDYKGDGEYIIYDLGMEHEINLIQFTTTNKSDPFGFQILVSTSGTADADFSVVLPETGDLILTATNTTDFNLYEVDAIMARYVKIMGYGRYNADGDTRTSVWSAVGEIEFYGEKLASSIKNEARDEVVIYPIPANNILQIKNLDRVHLISIYNLDGRRIFSKKISESTSEVELDISGIQNGMYGIILQGEGGNQGEVFVISR